MSHGYKTPHSVWSLLPQRAEEFLQQPRTVSMALLFPHFTGKKWLYKAFPYTALEWKALPDCPALQNALQTQSSLPAVNSGTQSSLTPRFFQLSTPPGPAQAPQPEPLFLMFLCSKTHTGSKKGARGQTPMPAHVLPSIFTFSLLYSVSNYDK